MRLGWMAEDDIQRILDHLKADEVWSGSVCEPELTVSSRGICRG